MYRSIKRPASDFRDICRALNYRKRTVYVTVTERVTITDVNWSGGTRSTYHGLDIASGAINTANHFSVPAPWANQYEGAVVDLKPGKAIVRTGFFCGKVSAMTIYIHPDNMPALLGSE